VSGEHTRSAEYIALPGFALDPHVRGIVIIETDEDAFHFPEVTISLTPESAKALRAILDAFDWNATP